MENTIGQRIKQLREAKQLSVTDFAKAAGVKPSAIYGLESDANKPSIETVGHLRTSFPDLSTEWLQFGIGTMFKGEKELTPLAQLPPPVPSEAKPTQPGSGEQPTLPHMAINADGEVYWRSVATERLKQIETLEKTVERLWDQNTTLLKKPAASPDAASLHETVDDIARELAQPASRAVIHGFVHRQLAVAS